MSVHPGLRHPYHPMLEVIHGRRPPPSHVGRPHERRAPRLRFRGLTNNGIAEGGVMFWRQRLLLAASAATALSVDSRPTTSSPR